MSKKREKKQPFDLSARILAEMAQDGYVPCRSKELARRLGVEKRDHRAFREILKAMADDGLVVRHHAGWGLPAPEEFVEGALHLTRAGHGFVIPDDASQDDLYVPENSLGSALHGDRVRARLERPTTGRDFRHYGVIVNVVERGSPRIVATIESSGFARPEDPKNPYDYAVESAPPDLKPGWKVLFEITAWPGDGPAPRGRVLEILGPAGSPDTETAAILAGHDAPGPFPDAVKTEVRRLARDLTDAERAERLDLTKDVIFTIDPKDARDFDDALSYVKRPDGSMLVGVHIADVSHFVRPGSRLDEEARDRSTSIYLPERVIPMLPEELSNDLCSLRPDEEHLTKTVVLHYAPDGKRLGYVIHRSLIRSRRRFTYEEVKDLLSDPAKEAAFDDRPVMESLRGLHDFAQILRQKRLDEGSIELALPEFKVVMDADGNAADIIKVEHDFSHQLVEEFMLAANAALAEWSAANGLPVLHRQHEAPSEDDLADLARFLTACGYPLKPPFRRERIKDILARAAGKPEEHAINLSILKSFRKAVYGAEPDIGHFALNFPKYLHFTSPIRRYPDLHLHQMLDAAFTPGADKLPKKLKKLPARGGKALERLGAHTSQRERRAMEIEEEVKDFRRLELLSHKTQRVFNAVVTGVRPFGVFVEIEEYFVEGMLPRRMLEEKGFSTREETPNAPRVRTGRGGITPGFHLGQLVRVRITRIDLAARLCEMEFLDAVGGAS